MLKNELVTETTPIRCMVFV